MTAPSTPAAVSDSVVAPDESLLPPPPRRVRLAWKIGRGALLLLFPPVWIPFGLVVGCMSLFGDMVLHDRPSEVSAQWLVWASILFGISAGVPVGLVLIARHFFAQRRLMMHGHAVRGRVVDVRIQSGNQGKVAAFVDYEVPAPLPHAGAVRTARVSVKVGDELRTRGWLTLLHQGSRCVPLESSVFIVENQDVAPVARPVPRLAFVALGLVIGGGLLGLAVAGRAHQTHIRSLQPSQVQAVTFTMDGVVGGEMRHETVELSPEQRAEFLRLLAASNSMSPSHPQGGWTCEVGIRTRSSDYRYRMHATSNNGTFLWMFSGGGDGWNLGCLRNDGFRPMVERAFENRWGGPLEPGTLKPQGNGG